MADFHHGGGGGGSSDAHHNKKRKQGGGGGSGGGGGGNNGFKSLGLSEPVYRGIVRMGFRMPTPVQRKALPVALSGADTVVMARTGSGKTCAFLIPLLEKLLASPKPQSGGGCVRAVILSPTRELSMQTLRVFHKLSSDCEDIKAIGIHGGEGMEKQFNMLASKPDVIIATPGRLAHHISEIPDFHLDGCIMCILDEADRLLEMGFASQIRQIVRSMKDESCQKLLFSATMPKVLVEFTKSGFATDPTVVRLDNEATVSSDLRISFITCRSTDKDAALLHILNQIRQDQEQHSDTRTGLTLIFAATRHHVEYITTLLSASGIANATMIYGTLDHEARKLNLSAFRSGKKPVLVVTDVAARGIDVPLIDHVVHYHFPPSPKLFVHRSGRAARAGRIGFCWSLVEPDELPYMVDLHLFLGRKLQSGISTTATTADKEMDGDKTGDDKEGGGGKKKELSYTLNDMTPDMVHYGSVPESIITAEVENVQRIMNSELSGSIEAESLRASTRVCKNAMKQYRKTRVEPSREGIRRAKAILEGDRLETGQRVTGGAIPPHPLLIGIVRKLQTERKKGSLGDLENTLKREEFLRSMSQFRPKETVFEAFATGRAKSKDSGGVVSQVDKGRTTTKVNNKNKNDSSAALMAMKNMRRQMRIARDKGSTLVVAGSAAAASKEEGDTSKSNEVKNIYVNQDHDGVESSSIAADNMLHPSAKVATSKLKHPPTNNPISVITADDLKSCTNNTTKRRMSRAERRRLKKNPTAASTSAPTATGASTSTTAATMPDGGGSSSNNNYKPTKEKRGSDFRDPAYFIDTDFTKNSEEAHRSRQIEAAMQPSSAASTKGSFGTALRIEEAMLDIVGDENDELVKKQRMMRWDKSKRKYVQTTVGQELNSDGSKSKRMKLESGQVVKSGKLNLGELYEKWQKKTNRSVGRSGVFDDADEGGVAATPTTSKKKGKAASSSRVPPADEIKTASAIKKERQKKQNLAMKNMKRSERRVIENKHREEKAHVQKKAARRNPKSRK